MGPAFALAVAMAPWPQLLWGAGGGDSFTAPALSVLRELLSFFSPLQVQREQQSPIGAVLHVSLACMDSVTAPSLKSLVP